MSVSTSSGSAARARRRSASPSRAWRRPPSAICARPAATSSGTLSGWLASAAEAAARAVAEQLAALRAEHAKAGGSDLQILAVQIEQAEQETQSRRLQLGDLTGKVARALRALEGGHAGTPDAYHIGHVAQACALGYLDLRFEGRWRAGHPRCVAGLDTFEARGPSFAATRFTP